MLDQMVAMPLFDSVVSLVWMGGLAIVLVGRAVISWVRFRSATKVAVQARRLAEATLELAKPRPTVVSENADILAFRGRRTVPTRARPEA